MAAISHLERCKRYDLKRWNSIKTFLGGKCVHCGNIDYRVLEIDHINNDNIREQGLSDRIRDIKCLGVEKYQLLCANCHSVKTKQYRNSKNRKPIDNYETPFEYLKQAKEHMRDRRKQAIEKLGSKCNNCAHTVTESLVFNRKDGLRGFSTSKVLSQILIQESEDYNLLCCNCKIINEYIGG